MGVPEVEGNCVVAMPDGAWKARYTHMSEPKSNSTIANRPAQSESIMVEVLLTDNGSGHSLRVLTEDSTKKAEVAPVAEKMVPALIGR